MELNQSTKLREKVQHLTHDDSSILLDSIWQFHRFVSNKPMSSERILYMKWRNQVVREIDNYDLQDALLRPKKPMSKAYPFSKIKYAFK